MKFTPTQVGLRPAAKFIQTLSLTAAVVMLVGGLGTTQSVQAAECENPDSLTFAMIPTERGLRFSSFINRVHIQC